MLTPSKAETTQISPKNNHQSHGKIVKIGSKPPDSLHTFPQLMGLNEYITKKTPDKLLFNKSPSPSEHLIRLIPFFKSKIVRINSLTQIYS